MKNIAFIINPISGTQNKKRLPKQIEKELDGSQWLPNIVFTEYAGHATELASQYARMGFDAVVAVGGDGTVNEVASGLRDTDTALGILPLGSGNGFARHIGQSTLVNHALDQINHSEIIACDYGMLNDRPFFCTCGMGFDAKVADDFAGNKKRGLTAYIQNILKGYFGYKPQHYHLIGPDFEQDVNAFLITCANVAQWGYDAYIAPKASIQDGLLDIVILSSLPLLAVPKLAIKLFTKSLDEDMYINVIKTPYVRILRDDEAPMHIDGDPVHMPAEINIRIVRDGMKILVKKRF